jgi:hypothetical protein
MCLAGPATQDTGPENRPLPGGRGEGITSPPGRKRQTPPVRPPKPTAGHKKNGHRFGSRWPPSIQSGEDWIRGIQPGEGWIGVCKTGSAGRPCTVSWAGIE